jgi:hypothetical protein
MNSLSDTQQFYLKTEAGPVSEVLSSLRLLDEWRGREIRQSQVQWAITTRSLEVHNGKFAVSSCPRKLLSHQLSCPRDSLLHESPALQIHCLMTHPVPEIYSIMGHPVLEIYCLINYLVLEICCLVSHPVLEIHCLVSHPALQIHCLMSRPVLLISITTDSVFYFHQLST